MGASNAGRLTRAVWVSARACSTATALARARGSRRTRRSTLAGGTGTAVARAHLFSGGSSGTLPMLRPLADLGRALVPANVALAPEQPNGLRRTARGGA
jgi:hypothetical protein